MVLETKGWRCDDDDMRPAIIFLASLALVPAATFAKDAPPTAEERDLAIKGYMGCMFEGAAKLDDGVSDALTVGATVARQCRSQLNTMVDVIARGKNRHVHDLFLDRRIADEAQSGADVVVTLRAHRRANPAP
jgi:hypothetical protein